MELILLSQHGKIHSFLLVPCFSLECSIFLSSLVLRNTYNDWKVYDLPEKGGCSLFIPLTVTHGDVTPEVNLSIKLFIFDSRNAIY